MISKIQSDEERTFMERAAAALNRTADFLWILFYLLKNEPGAKSLRRQIEINNDIMDDIEEAKDEESEEYRKSA